MPHPALRDDIHFYALSFCGAVMYEKKDAIRVEFS